MRWDRTTGSGSTALPSSEKSELVECEGYRGQLDNAVRPSTSKVGYTRMNSGQATLTGMYLKVSGIDFVAQTRTDRSRVSGLPSCTFPFGLSWTRHPALACGYSFSCLHLFE